jgi:hypothetical protein
MRPAAALAAAAPAAPRPAAATALLAAAAVLALVAGVASCSGRPAVSSCDDDLRGIYADGAERWMLLDSGPTLEAYPLFSDAPGSPDLVAGPRRLELARDASGLSGALRRWYMQRSALCDASVPAHVTRCGGDALEIVLADPAPPLSFAPCRWPSPADSRLVRWRRN